LWFEVRAPRPHAQEPPLTPVNPQAFPIVFSEKRGFNLGVSTLPFLGFLVTGAITVFVYIEYHRRYLMPKYDKNDWNVAPEERLRLALFAVPFVPVALFIFGWTGQYSNVHWIGPTIGAALYFPYVQRPPLLLAQSRTDPLALPHRSGIYCAFQCILLYLQLIYQEKAASVLAANDLFRSSMAAGFPYVSSFLFSFPALVLLPSLSLPLSRGACDEL